MNKKVDSTRSITSRSMTTALTLLAVGILMLVVAAPAAAARPGKVSQSLTDVAGLADRIHDLTPVTEEEEEAGLVLLLEPVQMYPLAPIGDGGGFEPVYPEEPLPGDGGDWEPVFPEDDAPQDAGDEETVPDDCVPDDGADQPEQPADDGGDEADQPDQPEQPADDGGDQADEPQDQVDEQADETAQPEAPAQEQPSDEQPTLAYTGGDNTPYLIAGAAIVLFGLMALRRRRDESERD